MVRYCTPKAIFTRYTNSLVPLLSDANRFTSISQGCCSSIRAILQFSLCQGNNWLGYIDNMNPLRTITKNTAQQNRAHFRSHYSDNRFSGAHQRSIKVLRHWPLWWECTGGFPVRGASNAKNIFIVILVALIERNSRVAGHFEYKYVDIK